MTLSVEAYGQGPQGSGTPYSAYGFGTLAGSTQTVQAMMGGVGTAVADPYGLSIANPASYPFLGHTIFESGIAVRNVRYESANTRSNGRGARMQGLTLGVPFGKGRWGLGMGVSPVSSVNYSIKGTSTVDSKTVNMLYTGQGGLDRAFLGLGYLVWQSNDTLSRGSKLSIGANVDYVFGSVEQQSKAYYPTGSGYYNSSVSNSLILRSPASVVGLQFAGDLVDKHKAQARMNARKEAALARDRKEEMDHLNAGLDPAARKPVRIPKRAGEAIRYRIGLSAELPVSMSARYTAVANNFVISATGVEFPRDSSLFIDNAAGTVEMPLLLSVGFALQTSRWMVSVEHRYRDWSRSALLVDGYEPTGQLVEARSYSLGASFRPAGEDRGNFWKGTIYRAGLRYADDYIMVNNTTFNQVGLSVGLSMPLMSATSRSRFSVGAEFGQRGTTDNGLIRERYADIYFGVTITPDFREQWFKKRRIE